MMNTRALAIASTFGTFLQVSMVAAGHSNDTVKSMFAVGGMAISLLAGLVCALLTPGRERTTGGLIGAGAISGAICAFIGILLSRGLGDVPASLILLGTASSAVTGAIGGAIGKFFEGADKAETPNG